MIYTSEEQNLIVLAAIAEMNYNERSACLSALMSTTPDFAACKNLLIKRCGIGVYNKVKDSFYDPAFRKGVFAELDERGVECVTYFSPDYPEPLEHIPTPPIVLFLKGNRELLRNRCFSIVGSRRTTPASLIQCKNFAKEISSHFTVVSGSAQGADSAALEGAEGRAISVVAFGFDYLELRSTQLKCLSQKGLFLSEYYPTVAPQTFLYHARNRIIAGLSAGTLVVSAGEKSGAIITANYAADFGREVFAFPYNIGVSSGAGCNNLIKQGANLCCNPLDIFNAFGLDLKPSLVITLSEDEKRAYAAIKEYGEIFAQTLAQNLSVPPFKLIPILSSLEIKGLICRLGGNRYSII